MPRPYDQDADPDLCEKEASCLPDDHTYTWPCARAAYPMDDDHEGNFVDGLAVALALLLILLSVAIAVWAVFGA